MKQGTSQNIKDFVANILVKSEPLDLSPETILAIVLNGLKKKIHLIIIPFVLFKPKNNLSHITQKVKICSYVVLSYEGSILK